MTLEEAREILKSGDEWAVADAIIADVYPGWNTHVPNGGLLRGAIAAVLLEMMRHFKSELAGLCESTGICPPEEFLAAVGDLARTVTSADAPEVAAQGAVTLPAELNAAQLSALGDALARAFETDGPEAVSAGCPLCRAPRMVADSGTGGVYGEVYGTRPGWLLESAAGGCPVYARCGCNPLEPDADPDAPHVVTGG